MNKRIQKIMSERGYCARRKAEELIAGGAVRVNGRVAATGDSADDRDVITVNGEKIGEKPVHKYIKMYKPRGYTVSLDDSHNEKLVTALLKNEARLFPVGRLDKNSEGLLLFTNDGDFANVVTHPKNGVTKAYRVTIPSKVTEEQVARLEAGVDIGDDTPTAPCDVDIVTQEATRTVLVIRIGEGRNRQIRRMCEAAGFEVSRLKRTEISTKAGQVKLGMLKPGEYVDLTSAEIAALAGQSFVKRGSKPQGKPHVAKSQNGKPHVAKSQNGKSYGIKPQGLPYDEKRVRGRGKSGKAEY